MNGESCTKSKYALLQASLLDSYKSKLEQNGSSLIYTYENGTILFLNEIMI